MTAIAIPARKGGDCLQAPFTGSVGLVEASPDPLRPIPLVPQCIEPDPRMLELAGKDIWSDDDWDYALMRENEGDEL